MSVFVSFLLPLKNTGASGAVTLTNFHVGVTLPVPVTKKFTVSLIKSIGSYCGGPFGCAFFAAALQTEISDTISVAKSITLFLAAFTASNAALAVLSSVALWTSMTFS